MRRFLMLLCLWPCLLCAQHRHTVKLDVGALAQKAIGIAYGLQINERSGIELSVYYQKYNDKPDWVFNGDEISHYLQRKLDTFNLAGRLLGSSGWQNIESQPLPIASETMPIYSMQFRLGSRFDFGFKNNRWRFFLQPGIAVSSTRFYTINTDKVTIHQSEDSWAIGTYPFISEIDRESVAYQQTRAMRLKNQWTGGVYYSIGVLRKCGRHFMLEARLSAGYNATLPYHASTSPGLVGNLWTSPGLLAGWAF